MKLIHLYLKLLRPVFPDEAEHEGLRVRVWVAGGRPSASGWQMFDWRQR